MDEVRKTLALAFSKLTEIATTHNEALKSGEMEQEQLELLILEITETESTLHEAALRAAGYMTEVLYAIGKETAPGEYAGFTHGPVPQRELMVEVGTSGFADDGDALVRIETKGGVINHVSEMIWLDGEWHDTDDELKEATA